MQITTERLLLRPVKHADRTILLAILNEPVCLEFNDYGSEVTSEELKDWIQWDIEHHLAGDGIRFVIEHKESGRVIGSIGLFRCDEESAMELGLELSQSFQNQGFMSESLTAIYTHYETLLLPYENHIGRVNGHNSNALKLLGKFGFKQELHENGVVKLKRTHHTK
jgi:ribosomal-protein-alanine N-acetyltransferase